MNNYGIYKDNPSARSIINSAIRSSEKPTNKYNVGVLHNREELTGEVAADERGASDTGMKMDKTHD